MEAFIHVLAYVVWFLATYFLVAFALVLIVNRDKLYRKTRLPRNVRPMVSVVVPAYNEEGKIGKTIASLKRVRYLNAEFIIVNDGSKDGTSSEVENAIKGDGRFRFINREQNKGKAASLNEAIGVARGDFVACMDADSMIEPRILEKTLPVMLQDNRTGAVTVTVEVSKPRRLLHRIIDVEYNIGLSLFLKVFSLMDAVFVTPGPFTLFRRSMLLEIGGFDEKNITEDMEIAYRIHKAGYRIDCCLEAKVRTICPPRFKDIYVQRRRWYSGAILTWFKHRKMLGKARYGIFGTFIPYHIILLVLGMTLFVSTTALLTYNTIDHLANFRHTNFNFLDYLFQFEFDILKIRQVSLVGLSSFIAGIGIMLLSLHFTRQQLSEKRLGILGYPAIFLLYQVFWLGAVYAVIRRKRITWR
jgi:cellulose synthase/poly-beta-1,6-N-acetylglucosamine synthase-like glycosyltransferase